MIILHLSPEPKEFKLLFDTIPYYSYFNGDCFELALTNMRQAGIIVPSDRNYTKDK